MNASFNVYPNPVNDKLYIEAETEIEEVVVYDVYGRHQVTETPSHQGNLSVDVTDLNSGVYFVKVVTEKGPLYPILSRWHRDKQGWVPPQKRRPFGCPFGCVPRAGRT